MKTGYFTKWIAAVAAAAALLVCSPSASVRMTAQAAQTTAKAGLDKTSVVLDLKQTEKVTLKNVTGTPVWSSSNAAVAKVKGSGRSAVITAGSKAGKAVITATVNAKKYNCTVTVAKFALSSSKLTLKSGKKASLVLKNAARASITWKSSKPEVVEICKITKHIVKLKAGAKAGTAKITAKVGKKTYTCNVTVKLNSVSGSWSGNQFIKSSGGALSGGAYPIGSSYYVFDESGYLVSEGWHAINGYWYYADSQGRTTAGGWANVPDNTQDTYWTNYSFYHDKKYFDSQGRWDMRKANKVVWDTVYEVVPKHQRDCKDGELQQAVYVIKPKKGKKGGYYQWIMKNSVKFNDNRPIYAVKSKVYVAFGAPYSIQVKDVDLSIAKDNDPMLKMVYPVQKPHVIGWIGSKKIIYP